MRPKLTTLAAGIALAGLTTLAVAQTVTPPQTAPNMPAPQNVPAEKVDPPLGRSDPGTTGATGSGGNLSEKLEATDGVIRPPSNISPDMAVPAPNTGTTPVIRPPGTSPSDPVQPK